MNQDNEVILAFLKLERAMRRFPPESRAGILCQSKMRFI